MGVPSLTHSQEKKVYGLATLSMYKKYLITTKKIIDELAKKIRLPFLL
jgi:hypothetical protein